MIRLWPERDREAFDGVFHQEMSLLIYNVFPPKKQKNIFRIIRANRLEMRFQIDLPMTSLFIASKHPNSICHADRHV